MHAKHGFFSMEKKFCCFPPDLYLPLAHRKTIPSKLLHHVCK
jgi:hypothetical protein